MKIIKYIILFILIIQLPISSFAQDKWDLEKDKNGIKVYTKTKTGSDYKSFKAEMQANCSIEDVVRILKNVDKFKTWIADCKVVKLLKMEENDQYHYIETIVPWPFENRDMIYHFEYTRINDKQMKVIITGLPEYIKPKKDIIRMEKANGYWLLTSTGTNKTKIIYSMHAEPGGVIPAWLANTSVVDMPFSTLLELKKILTNN